MERKCVRKARIHMFPSMQMKALYEKTYGFESKKYFIPCSGAGTVYGSGGSPGADLIKKIPAKGIRILTVGGLSEERKGSKAIIEAMSSPGLEDAWLIVAGKIAVDVPEPLKNRTVPLGSVDFREMPALYQNCDLLIFPSIYEGFPNVLLEAAYYGLPMISSRLEGVGEYFRDGKDILLVEKNDPNGLADRIKTLSASPEMRKKLSMNAKSRAEAIAYGYSCGSLFHSYPRKTDIKRIF
jgi:glycosyltransferase involved in cell wall biosynthesis